MNTSIAMKWAIVGTIGCLGALAAAQPAGGQAKLLEVRKIWDGAPHNAFTDLIRFGDNWLCVFREGSGHIPGTDGKIRVIRSADGQQWESAALIAEKGIDLRDPKISQMPDGRLMIVMGGSVYDGQEPAPGRKRVSAWSRVSFSKDGAEWTSPQKVEGVGENTWLWRVTWHKGAGYGAVYSVDPKSGKRAMSVWRTNDGVRYEKLCQPDPGVNLSEFTIRFLPDDTMVILLRAEDKNRRAWVGNAKAPFDKWEWVQGACSAQGPNFIVLGQDRMYYAGRHFEDGKAKTAFGSMTLQGLTPLVMLPSGGDNSYPGLAMADGRTMWISYYSSHEKKTSIYLAKVALP